MPFRGKQSRFLAILVSFGLATELTAGTIYLDSPYLNPAPVTPPQPMTDPFGGSQSLQGVDAAGNGVDQAAQGEKEEGEQRDQAEGENNNEEANRRDQRATAQNDQGTATKKVHEQLQQRQRQATANEGKPFKHNGQNFVEDGGKVYAADQKALDYLKGNPRDGYVSKIAGKPTVRDQVYNAGSSQPAPSSSAPSPSAPSSSASGGGQPGAQPSQASAPHSPANAGQNSNNNAPTDIVKDLSEPVKPAATEAKPAQAETPSPTMDTASNAQKPSTDPGSSAQQKPAFDDAYVARVQEAIDTGGEIPWPDKTAPDYKQQADIWNRSSRIGEMMDSYAAESARQFPNASADKLDTMMVRQGAVLEHTTANVAGDMYNPHRPTHFNYENFAQSRANFDAGFRQEVGPTAIRGEELIYKAGQTYGGIMPAVAPFLIGW